MSLNLIVQKIVIKKVQAILSRYQDTNPNDLNTYGILNYNFDKYELLVDNTLVSLNKKEWALLQLFIHNIGRVFSREDLLNLVWGYDYLAMIEQLTHTLKGLDKKLGPLHQATLKPFIRVAINSKNKSKRKVMRHENKSIH